MNLIEQLAFQHLFYLELAKMSLINLPEIIIKMPETNVNTLFRLQI